MHARLYDNFRVRLGRLARELQRIPDEVCDAVEDFRRHVIVGENDGVLFAFECVDGQHIGRMRRPFDLGNDMRNLLVEPARGPRDLGRVGEVGFTVLHLRPSSLPPNNTRYEYIYGAKRPAFKAGEQALCYI